MSTSTILLTQSNQNQVDNNKEILFLSKEAIMERTELNQHTLNNYIANLRPTDKECKRMGKGISYSLEYLINLFTLKAPDLVQFLTSTKPKVLTNNQDKNNLIISELNLKVNELENKLKQLELNKENQLNLKDKHILTFADANQTLTKANNDLNDRVKELIQNNDSLTKAITNSQSLQLQTQMALKDALDIKNLLPEHLESSKQVKIEERKKFLGIF